MASKNSEKTRYSDKELKEFEALIMNKLENARNELNLLKDSLSQLAARQQKFITNLENALVRIKNGTYGVCSVTGNLIGKERLKAVPHTTLSIEAKLQQKS